MFEIGGKHHVLSIFEFISPDKGYLKHPLKYEKRHSLALGYVPNTSTKPRGIIELHRLLIDSPAFIHSEEIGN